MFCMNLRSFFWPFLASSIDENAERTGNDQATLGKCLSELIFYSLSLHLTIIKAKVCDVL